VYLVEGIVPKDRRVGFDDMDAEDACMAETGCPDGKMPEDTLPDKAI